VKRLLSQLFAVLALVSFSATASDDPSHFLQIMAKKLTDKVAAQKQAMAANPKLAEQFVRHELLPLIDREGFAKRTLGKKLWGQATDTEKQKFIESFTDLVIATYAKGITLYDGQAFEFSAAKYNKKRTLALVQSKMKQSGGSPVKIDYKLIKKNDQWLIIDLTVEGVSMVKSYRNQFLPQIRELGFAQFVEQLAREKSKLIGKS